MPRQRSRARSNALRITLAGLACGIAAALGLTHRIAGLLYGVAPTDPVTFAALPPHRPRLLFLSRPAEAAG